MLGFDYCYTSRIEIITLSLEAIEIVSLLANLKLKIVDVLKIILPQPLPLLYLRRLDVYGRHGWGFFLSLLFFSWERRLLSSRGKREKIYFYFIFRLQRIGTLHYNWVWIGPAVLIIAQIQFNLLFVFLFFSNLLTMDPS